MGIEASFWRKPVILLGPSLYYRFGISYNPTKRDELWKYLDTKELPSLYNDMVLKFGYYYMSNNHERTKNISIDIYKRQIFGKTLVCCVEKKTFGSNFLYALIAKILNLKLIRNISAEFKNITFEEA